MSATKVFVHGNPETSAVWSLLVAELKKRGVDNIVLLTPPGFGAPTPAGWGGTMREYRDWLIAELEAIGGDIDLVGHDWGAGHVYGVLSEKPGIVRSWAADCAGLLHADYQWHDAAQGWQAPELGEQMVAGMVAMPDEQFVDALAMSLAAKPGYSLRTTKQQVNAVTEEMIGTARNANDADSLVIATYDAESRAASAAYLKSKNKG
jgi:pimeloyl-ACP methyl ester carboxylesterase